MTFTPPLPPPTPTASALKEGATFGASTSADLEQQRAAQENKQHSTGGDDTGPEQELYTIYTIGEQWALVSCCAIAGLFSPLPANIFFPAIPQMAEAFHKSTELINLTVTVYLAFQGIAPMAWGPLSDMLGRRPVFLICLFILVMSCIGLALTPTSAYWLLLLLRCVQASGCASMIALAAGVIGDISVPANRGGYFGWFNIGPMLAPNLGPAVGGALAQHLGWRSIMWFLTICSACCMLFVALLVPETLRALVGNGSTKVPFVYRALIPIIGRGRRTKTWDVSQRRLKFPNPFLLFRYRDVTIALVFTSVVYAVNYTITATISSSFASIYPFLSETSLGLCYLSTGGGMLLGSSLTGKLLDFEFKRIKKRVLERRGKESSVDVDEEGEKSSFSRDEDIAKDPSFPIEQARLRTMPFHLFIFVVATIGWGWCLQQEVAIAAPLVLQIILGYTSIAILNTTMTLMVDLLPSQSSSITACTNLCRCGLAAVLVALIDRATARLGFGWAYVVLGACSLLMLPLMLYVQKIGPRCRARRI